MRGIAEQRCAGHTPPSMSDRQRMDPAQHRIGFTVGDQGGKLRGPAAKLFGKMRQASFGVAEVDRVDPILRLLQGRISMQRAIGIAMRQNTLAGSNGHQRAAADRIRACLVARVAVEQRGLDERDAGVRRSRLRQQRTDLRPCTVGADEHVRCHRRAMGKGDVVPSVTARSDRRDLVSPSNRIRRDRIDQYAPKIAAVDLGARAGAAAGLVEQDMAVFVDDALGIFTGTD
ncbi:hypothetical protein chiPu_0030735, partial [Chiloscyllium punctatum]|nr:hypothetical protein [Chiloscyllium punctatum]